MNKHYRSNVAAILQRSDGRVLIARRSDFPESWQFPQGGIDPGETPQEALRREVSEEIALDPESYRIIAERGGYRYDYPSGKDRRGYAGQEQTYFLCSLEGNAVSAINPRHGCGEFTEVDWVSPSTFPFHLVPPMKQKVYRCVLQDFFPLNSEDKGIPSRKPLPPMGCCR